MEALWPGKATPRRVGCVRGLTLCLRLLDGKLGVAQVSSPFPVPSRPFLPMHPVLGVANGVLLIQIAVSS